MRAVVAAVLVAWLSPAEGWQTVQVGRPPPRVSMMAEERRPWEFGRFVRTASFFQTLPSFLRPGSKTRTLQPGTVIFDGTNPLDLSFGPLDDVVMGGASESGLVGTCWEGSVTTANNGGFAGVRSRAISLDLSACRGIRLRVKADGKRYKFIIRDDEDWNGVAWSHSFDTKDGAFVEVKVPFEKFVPTRFAKVIPGVTFDRSTFSSVQFTLSKFEYDNDLNPKFNTGPFYMDIASISTF